MNPSQGDVDAACEALNETTGGETTGGTTGGGTTGGGGAAPAAGALPFTGFSMWIPLLLAGSLMGAGAWVLRKRPDASA